MSYDLMVFEPSAAPTDRAGFLAWYASIARMGDGKLTNDPATTSPTLQAWHRDMIRHFPSTLAPDGSELLDIEDDRHGEYRFSELAVFAGFRWEVSRHVYRQASKLARTHNVGFFEVSGETAAVWGPTPKGFYSLLHRNE